MAVQRMESGYMRRSWGKIIKLTYLQTSLLFMLGYFFLFGEIRTFAETGDNFFTVLLNGVEVGSVADVEIAEELLIQARRNIAGREAELVLMEVDLSCVGEEVLWGEIDDKQQVLTNMETVLSSFEKETLNRSYTIKVNEYVANLASIEEVKTVLQTAIDKYDTEGRFEVEIKQNHTREFNTLEAEVIVRPEEETKEAVAFLEAGLQAHLTEISKAVEPEKEKDFEDYELGISQMYFSEEVEIVEAYLPKSQLVSVEQAVADLIKEHETVTTYEVVSGDTLSEIAIKVNIPMDKLIEMNDSLESEKTIIRVGDELIITIPEPELSVVRKEEQYIEEVYDGDVIYVENDNWYTTQTKVLQQPSAGFRKIIAVSTYENDKVVSREIIKEEIVLEAIPKIVERGTKIPPTYIKPISGGRLSSSFGKRSRPTKGASTYHKGVDWAVPKGTTVWASSGGTVTRAGWGSGYGYVVYIDHADGRQTRYAHLSKVLVKVGQAVSQGDTIALSGNTGVSSGPHVHFEILINGKQVNPLKYIE